MSNFSELVRSRRGWIDEVLTPWCRAAARDDLLQAAEEWLDIAGKVDVESTLWTWAWSRFPPLVYEGLPGINETHPVLVTLADGRIVSGFPDSRAGEPGELVLVEAGEAATTHGPFSIDEIECVAAAASGS